MAADSADDRVCISYIKYIESSEVFFLNPAKCVPIVVYSVFYCLIVFYVNFSNCNSSNLIFLCCLNYFLLVNPVIINIVIKLFSGWRMICFVQWLYNHCVFLNNLLFSILNLSFLRSMPEKKFLVISEESKYGASHGFSNLVSFESHIIINEVLIFNTI